MKKVSIAFLCAAVTVLAAIPLQAIRANSIQSYQDYQYQFDQYRSRQSDFQVAMNQYQQFKSLASGQDALEKGKLFLAQRDTVAKTYFLFLNEKLTENPGMLPSETTFYRSIITNQIAFLDQNAVLAPSAASFADAGDISKAFDTQYDTMQSAYRQTVGAVELGYLNYFASRFDAQVVKAQSLIAQRKTDASPEKQAILDRWLLSLSNKHSLYQQKANTIRGSLSKITGDPQTQDRQFLQIQSQISAAKQDLVEAASYLKELENALKYE